MPTTDSRSLSRYAKAAVVHKVIDITPDPEPDSTQTTLAQILAIIHQHRTGLFGLATLLFVVIILSLTLPHAARPVAVAPTPPAPATPAEAKAPTVMVFEAAPKPVVIELNLPTAVQRGLVECQWRGNGKDRLVMDARNTGAQSLRLQLSAGQLLASDDSTIVVLRSQTLDFAPHGERHEEFQSVATSSGNRVVGAAYHLSSGALPDLDKLFAYVAAHPEATLASVQTATLILTENLPLSAFAKFNELSAGTELQENQAFKADTIDILSALAMIRDLGIQRPLAVTIDPQLEVESMIDPTAHALALRYYGITDEWAYWKNQLLAGDPSTRHYALYGIARFYPDVALQMLPKWARQETGSPVYRMSAVEALAQTGKAEAIPILRQLESEFGATSELGRAAHAGANYLDARFAHASDSLTSAAPARRPAAFASTGY
jgi:hypothetical protein